MGRPRTQILSQRVIVDAALAVLRRGKPWSLREVARHLEVNPSSIYHYFQNISDLVEAVRTRIVSSIEFEQFDNLPWEEAVLIWARSFRKAFASAPEFVGIAARYPVRGIATFRMYEFFARAALREGWQHHELLKLLTVFETYIFGSVLDSAGPPVVFDPSDVRHDAPEISRAFDDTSDGGTDPVSGPAFELGLRALIAGVRPLEKIPRNGSLRATTHDV